MVVSAADLKKIMEETEVEATRLAEEIFPYALSTIQDTLIDAAKRCVNSCSIDMDLIVSTIIKNKYENKVQAPFHLIANKVTQLVTDELMKDEGFKLNTQSYYCVNAIDIKW